MLQATSYIPQAVIYKMQLQFTNYNLQAAIYELQFTSSNLRATIYKL